MAKSPRKRQNSKKAKPKAASKAADGPRSLRVHQGAHSAERASMHITLVRIATVAVIVAWAFAATQVFGTWRLLTVASPWQPLAITNKQTSLESLRKQNVCTKGVVLNVVAHEDDDLLFMIPRLSDSIAAHKCIRTVYMTAGDDGQTSRYWQSREQGSEAAYAYMYNAANSWSTVEATIQGHSVETASLDGHPEVSLVFLHLPDGNPSGTGFATDNGETLNKLRVGTIGLVHSLDGKTSYSSAQLILVLKSVMAIDTPTEVNTQAYSSRLTSSDHSDHQAVGYFTDRAQKTYMSKHSFTMYYGYQLNGLPANLEEEQVAYKRAVFAAYENYDPEICHDSLQCFNDYSYQNYLSRQYAAVTLRRQ